MPITIPLIDDLHVHLRQGEMMEAVVPSIAQGGVGRVLVMPNLSPPVTTVAQAVEYRDKLKEILPSVEYFMTLYLSPAIRVEELRNAKNAGVVGVKSYPKGVTTGSDVGVEDYEVYFPIFAEMEKLGLSLHLHGEVPNTCVMRAEELFLTQLFKIHSAFPRLKIVLEHVTTEAAVNAVLACGPTVGATVTIHHMDLTISDVVGNNVNFCKPVAKLESDRKAIRDIVRSGNKKFFLGSDSAPHLLTNKKNHCGCPAGIFTQPYIAQYLADCFDRFNCLEHLESFACKNGAAFLGLPPRESTKTITLEKKPFKVAESFQVGNNCIFPYKAGQELSHSIKPHV
jgi:dihydroorotase